MPRSPAPAAVGFRAHSGWAAAVVLAGRPAAPEVVERRRVILAEPDDGVARQPFHAAEDLEPADAARLVKRCTADSQRRARAALADLRADLTGRGYALSACGLLANAGRPLPDLPGILASHALIHAAEGEMFREVLRQAAAGADLPLREWSEREMLDRCAAAARLPAERVQARLAEVGRALGPPWQQDQKLAALAAWTCLARR